MQSMFDSNNSNSCLVIAVFTLQTGSNRRYTEITIIFLNIFHDAIVDGIIGERNSPIIVVLPVHLEYDISARFVCVFFCLVHHIFY